MGDYSPTPDPYGLLAPDGADDARNGDNRMRALVDRLSDVLPLYAPVTTVDALPAAPVDGQVIYYQDAILAAANRVWGLHYDQAANKWLPCGAAPLAVVQSATTVTTSSGSYVVSPNGYADGPNLTLPRLVGTFLVENGARIAGDGLAAVDEPAFWTDDDAAIGPGTPMRLRTRNLDGTSGGATLEMRYKAASGSVDFTGRWIKLTPLVINPV